MTVLNIKCAHSSQLDLSSQYFSELCELYDPVTRLWSDAHILNNERYYHQTILFNNLVLTTGGFHNGGKEI